MPIPSSLQTSIDPMPLHFSSDVEENRGIIHVDSVVNHESCQQLHDEAAALLGHPLIIKEVTQGNH